MEEKIDYYIQKLKKKNIRMTEQRLAILEFLAIEGNHPTANEIYEELKYGTPNMSVATVYNNLRFFKEVGILEELSFGDGSSRFDLTEVRHYHAVCNHCGKVFDFDYPGLENINAYVEQRIPLKVENHHLKVSGLCADCQ